MNDDVIYWLYLEPYSFIFKEGGQALIYNTLNAAYITCSIDNISLCKIINDWEDADNGYCTSISEKELNDREIAIFLKKLCDSYSGNIVQACGKKPFIMKPICRIYDSVERIKKEANFSLGRNILLNLNEVSLYFPCENQSPSKVQYQNQFLHNFSFKNAILSLEDYILLIKKFEVLRVGRVNILGDNIFQYPYLSDILSSFANCDFKKVFYLDYSLLDNDVKSLYIDKLTSFVVHIHAPYDETVALNRMHQYSDLPIEWIFVVTTENELIQIEQLQEKTNANISVIPFYDGGNLAFFEKFVFNTLEDIIADPIDKQTIFRRQVLNENFFGKLTILPSGDVYANLNCKSIGNILQHSLAELVYKEITESTAWFKARNEGKCKNCVNKYLCPSPSNYEFVLQRENLCHVL